MKAIKHSLVLLVAMLLLNSMACSLGRDGLDGQAPIEPALAFQLNLNEQYTNEETSILTSTQIDKLKENGGLDFYPISSEFQIMADFIRFEEPELVQMETSTDRIADYQLFGRANFSLEGEVCELNLYKSTNPNLPEEYRDKLFLPFRDATSGKETYGGGRYLDVTIPRGNRIFIDFNKAYHPYCAYSYKFSCPVPPKSNDLTIPIRAGVKNTELGD
jgi:hypothetical protein